ncbi:hypothetical protein WME75_41405 [Sorangium sp. So ce1014]|uniref:hypothetical protein n=1 Tax=Sorangium sp. So ce1014 TaxID=3133326 RepID=UPI003F5FCBBB
MTDRAPADADGPEPADADLSAPADADGREPVAADRPAPAEPEPGSPPGGSADAEPRRRTKKRARQRGAASSPPGSAAPAIPRDPELVRLEQAFERGDYALVRAGAKRLLLSGAEPDDLRGVPSAKRHSSRPPGESQAQRDDAEDAEGERVHVRRAARALLRRIDPDPLAVALLLAAIALLAFLSLWYWSHSHVP